MCFVEWRESGKQCLKASSVLSSSEINQEINTITQLTENCPISRLTAQFLKKHEIV